jgi:gamma-glutamyl-gamma-aminobutyrate hydrolase PuuD
MNKVFIVESGREYRNMFEKAGWKVTNKPNEATLVCFTGGSDVSPSFYNEHKHPYSSINPQRDEEESNFFFHTKKNSIPMVGICRGGQFLNVMNGGRMYQHVEGHCGDHYMQDQITKDCILVSSTHHQMMRPSFDAFIVASTDVCIKEKQFMSPLGEVPIILATPPKEEADIEVVFYPKTKSLCFQPHPEFTGKAYERMTEYFFELINRYIERA